MSESIAIRPGDADDYQRCPSAYHQKSSGRRGTRIQSRSADRSSALRRAIEDAHRRNSIPTYEMLAAQFASTNPEFSPANPEERESLLSMLETYAEIAETLDGVFVDRNDPDLVRKSARIPVVARSREPLIFRHADGTGEIIEARQVTASRYRSAATEFEFASEFRTQLRHLVMDATFPGRTIRISEVNVVDGTWSAADRNPMQIRESAETVIRFVESLASDRIHEARPNNLCGTCSFMPSCPAIPKQRAGELW